MAGGPRSQAGEADRERVIGLLREHYAQGRLDAAELARRVGIALAAEFTDEVASALGDLPELIPPGLAGGRGGAATARRRRRARAGCRPRSGSATRPPR